MAIWGNLSAPLPPLPLTCGQPYIWADAPSSPALLLGGGTAERLARVRPPLAQDVHACTEAQRSPKAHTREHGCVGCGNMAACVPWSMPWRCLPSRGPRRDQVLKESHSHTDIDRAQ